LEVSQVRRRLLLATEQAKERAKGRREQNAAAEAAYATFLEQVAVPVAKQVANVLKAEGLPFTAFTPGNGLRLAYDRGRDDFVEISLDADGDVPQVVGRTSRTRGSRTIVEITPLFANGASEAGARADPAALSEEDVLEFLATAVGPWLER
jgi:hypothetical protein